MRIKIATLSGLVLSALLLLTACDPRSTAIVRPTDAPVASSLIANVPGIARMGGEWVVITEGHGKKGEPVASSWYLLRFREDSTLKLIWVTPGMNARERVHYTQVGNTVTITDAKEAPQVNNVPFTLQPDGYLKASIPNPGGGDNLLFTHRSIGWPYIHWIIICAGLTITFLMWRRWRWFTPVFMGAGIIVMSVYWINESDITAHFRWVKLYTLVVSVWFFWLVRYTPLHKYIWMRFLVAAILGVNIAEAVRVDFLSGYLPNILNGLAGIFSILAMTRWQAIGPNRMPVKDLVWPGQAVFWIIAYDIWNVAFSYLNFNEYTSNSIALNLVPTCIAIWVAGTWVSARGVTLGFFYIYLFTFTHLVMEKSFVPIPINNTVAHIVAIVSVVMNFVVCALVWGWKITKKGPAWPNFGQYRHAEMIVGDHDSIHLNLDKIPYKADYPPQKYIEEGKKDRGAV